LLAFGTCSVEVTVRSGVNRMTTARLRARPAAVAFASRRSVVPNVVLNRIRDRAAAGMAATSASTRRRRRSRFSASVPTQSVKPATTTPLVRSPMISEIDRCHAEDVVSPPGSVVPSTGKSWTVRVRSPSRKVTSMARSPSGVRDCAFSPGGRTLGQDESAGVSR
jgi:hypothetical protein